MNGLKIGFHNDSGDTTKVTTERLKIRVTGVIYKGIRMLSIKFKERLMTGTSERKCLECCRTFKGRTDKKFCSDLCRSAYNNRRNSEGNNYMRHVNNILRRNRRILIEVNATGRNRVSRRLLTSKGFNFSYFTSVYTTREGMRYYYCYEQGYLPVRKDYCLLVVKKPFKEEN